ncbi:MAG: hypothetical protein U5O39_12260 [Gammaproteobacteria bacterium]|nr:hypothetical protein [Gammaproteobacteria bacterium]
MITSDTSLIELATLVSEKLHEHGVDAVLSGGAAVAERRSVRFWKYFSRWDLNEIVLVGI